MRTLILHHSNVFNNIGDKLSYLGAINLLRQAKPDIIILPIDYSRALADQNYIQKHDWGEVDLIALAGSPWLWVGCHKSVKYRILMDALQRCPNAKVIGLGLGSCVSRATFYDMDCYFFGGEAKERLNEIFSRFSYVLCRDYFAQWMLNECSIQSDYYYDTAMFAYPKFARGDNFRLDRNKKLLFFYDPTRGLSKEDLSCNPQLYINYQLTWAKTNSADVFVNYAEDKKTLDDLGISSILATDLDWLFEQFITCGMMLSGRIHMAVLGLMAGINKIVVMPVDSRFFGLYNMNIEFKFIEEPWGLADANIPNLWEEVKRQEQLIVEIIRDKFGLK